MQIRSDKDGFPILLSEDANQNGNSNTVQADGKKEDNKSIEENARRHDSVREVARRYSHGDNEGVVKYLEGRITRPLTVDELDSFHKDVHQHRVNDLVDVLDHQLRGSGVLTRSYRAVKVSAPNGWTQGMLDSLKDDEVIFVARRLKNRGHDLADIQKFLGKRISKERFAKLSDKLDGDASLNLSAPGMVGGAFIGPGIIVMPDGDDITVDDLPTGLPSLPVNDMAEAIGKGVAAALKELK